MLVYYVPYFSVPFFLPRFQGHVFWIVGRQRDRRWGLIVLMKVVKVGYRVRLNWR